MSNIRNYLPYNNEMANTSECKELLDKWLMLVKSTISAHRKFILYLFDLKSVNIDQFEPYFTHEFVTELKRINEGKHQAYYNGNLFTLLSPQSCKCSSREDVSCIAFKNKQEDLFPLEDECYIKEILLLPWPNIGEYNAFRKASKIFITDDDFSCIEPDFGFDSKFKKEFIDTIQSTAIGMTQNLRHPNDIQKIKEGLSQLKRNFIGNLPLKEDMMGYLLYEYKNSKTGIKGCTYYNASFISKYLCD